MVKFIIKMSNGQKVQFYVSLEDAGEWLFFFFGEGSPCLNLVNVLWIKMKCVIS